MSNTHNKQRNTVRELAPAVGETVFVRMETFRVPCVVLDAKNSWGKVRLLVTPVYGEGEQWIELERLVVPQLAGTEVLA